jgi:hypothetical protein
MKSLSHYQIRAIFIYMAEWEMRKIRQRDDENEKDEQEEEEFERIE